MISADGTPKALAGRVIAVRPNGSSGCRRETMAPNEPASPYRVLHTAVFGHAPLWTSWSESVARGTVSFISGGLALEPVRGLPWLPPFLRVSDLFSTPAVTRPSSHSCRQSTIARGQVPNARCDGRNCSRLAKFPNYRRRSSTHPSVRHLVLLCVRQGYQ